MGYYIDARNLWHTVTSMKMLPGVPHALNDDLGVTERWKDFLRDQARGVLENILMDLRVHTQELHRPNYSVGKRFQRFIAAGNHMFSVMPVAEPAEQYVARRIVNAFTETWHQHYSAERQAELNAELEALARELEEAESEGENESATGPGQVVQAARSTSFGSDGEKHADQS
ncbi:phospholipase [Pseudozyma hubeiensis SY62]|uniref:Phospholipase n=1 Tax=Pseudozyma hubeiensis (strain SY62) TaxID=1305764 RepID=R9NZ84_PSEHS|nr:phospholipase [Pseudozyma hubeiensis SY62]GAC94069.1 phospholipase [Pseudozyma hubeiensis SY62]